MSRKTGWKQMKEIAAANNVSYSTYQSRIAAGQSPEDAASGPQKSVTEIEKVALVLEKYKPEVKTDGPMTREEALVQIDIQEVTGCGPCEIRTTMNRRNGNNSSRLEKICINECPVGKQIQKLSQYLYVNPRKSIKGEQI